MGTERKIWISRASDRAGERETREGKIWIQKIKLGLSKTERRRVSGFDSFLALYFFFIFVFCLLMMTMMPLLYVVASCAKTIKARAGVIYCI